MNDIVYASIVNGKLGDIIKTANGRDIYIYGCFLI